MRPLPTPPPTTAGTPALHRGLAILAFVIAEGVTATISLEDLSLADHAGPLASSGPDSLPIARERISWARHLVTLALKASANMPETISTAVVAHSEPAGGHLVALHPTPHKQPPSGNYANFAPMDRVQF